MDICLELGDISFELSDFIENNYKCNYNQVTSPWNFG